VADLAFDAVFLDAGGVLVSPLPQRVVAALSALGVEIDTDGLLEAHYRGMHAVDLARSDPEFFGDYYGGYLGHFGYDAVEHAELIVAATAALDAEWAAGNLWVHPVPGAAEGLALLAETGLPLVVVSNADGTVDRLLATSGLVQVGPGPGVELVGIIDSGAVGVAKPDPRIFEIALDLVGVAPERALHVGDAYSYDVGGARAAGIHPVLVDPLDLRPDLDCDRIDSLAQIGTILGR
jgi:putative hydrolase of the HAD superfamily